MSDGYDVYKTEYYQRIKEDALRYIKEFGESPYDFKQRASSLIKEQNQKSSDLQNTIDRQLQEIIELKAEILIQESLVEYFKNKFMNTLEEIKGVSN